MSNYEAEWSSRQGDGISRSWTRETSGREFDGSTLLVQMRTTDGTLIASNEDPTPDDAVAIDTSDSDFTDTDAYVFAFTITDTDDIEPSTDNLKYMIEAQCEIDGIVTTFFSREWTILPQFAIPS